MNAFEYVRAASVAEAVERLAADPEGTRLLAGGTDLLVFMADGKLQPRVVVDLKHIAELPGLTVNGCLRLGARTTLREVEREPAVIADYSALAAGAAEVGSVQIRNRATLAGNLGTASPAADTPPALLVLGAVVLVAGPGGSRRLPIAEFHVGPGRSALRPGELISGVELPAPAPRSGSAYHKLAARRAMDIAFVGVAAAVTLAADGTVADAQVALGAVAPTPRLVAGIAELLRGRVLDDEALAAAAEAAMTAASPISDQRAGADYRRAMAGVLTRRALRQAAAQAEAR